MVAAACGTGPRFTLELANVALGARSKRTAPAFRALAIHMEEPARQSARELANTQEVAKAQRQKTRVEDKEGGSPVRGTQESDRTPPPAITQIEVRAGAVLSSGGCTESQTPGPVPQPTYKTCSS